MREPIVIDTLEADPYVSPENKWVHVVQRRIERWGQIMMLSDTRWNYSGRVVYWVLATTILAEERPPRIIPPPFRCWEDAWVASHLYADLCEDALALQEHEAFLRDNPVIPLPHV